MISSALAVRGLGVELRVRDAFRPLVGDLDFSLPAGKITGLAGASGSGKTLTALALMGLADPRTFRVRCERLTIAGEDLDTRSDHAMQAARGRRLAMVFQDPATALDPVFTVGHQLRRAIARLPGVDRGAARARAVQALAEVGFPDPEGLFRRYPHELSGGMRQLVVIAMAQAVRPRVLLADEPTTALDAVTQSIVLHRLQELAEAAGTAVLLITHDLRLLTRFAHDVMVMGEGRIVERLSGTAFFAEPDAEGRHEFTRRLVTALPRLQPAEGDPPREDEPPLLTLRDLEGSYGRRSALWRKGDRPVRALRGVSLDLHAGRMFGLAGESGSGKSTLARMLVRLVPAQGGSVRLEGEELLHARGTVEREARRRIQLVFQDPASALSPRRTVAQSLAEPARHFGLDASPDVLTNALEAVGLDASALQRYPRQFSSGQRQRIAIARALVCDPDLLIADEALSALDVFVQAQVLEVLKNLRDRRGMSILLISHDLAVLAQHADDIGVMYRGHLVEQAPARQLITAPAHPYTRQLLAALPRLDPAIPLAAPEPDAALAGPAEGPGCVFAPRCPEAFDRCDREASRPHRAPGDRAHHVECHLLEPEP